MQVQIDIGFEQLVKIVKTLPPKQRKQLQAELAKETPTKSQQPSLETLLLNGPVATKKQLQTIDANRKAINQWRIK